MMTTSRKTGIYIHIPFCVRKCLYCDFLSFENASWKESYLDALTEEIKGRSRGEAVDSIFIGGGTPSLLTPSQMSQLMETVYDCFDVQKDCEITMEANPGTVNLESLKGYRDCGVNRISFGVQSFSDDILKGLGRIHTSEDAYRAYEQARQAGFANVSIDLMFAVPGLTEKLWDQTMEKAFELDPEHISFYSLQIEEGTPYFQMFEEGTLTQTSEEDDRIMYHSAIEKLKEHGYVHYEVSNAAKKGFESRHNLKYWSMEDYLGFGLGASSFSEGKRRQNTCSPQQYISGNGMEGMDIHVNTPEDSASEFVFTGLRKLKGISLLEFEEYTGRNFYEFYPGIGNKIREWERCGLAVMSGDNFRLTVSGMDVQNSILMEFV